METSSLMTFKPDEMIECWDDDEDLQYGDGLQFRTTSTNTSVTGSSVRPYGHRDSISSRRSCRSDRDSNVGDDESWQLLLHENDDDSSTQDAIDSAKKAGILIPIDVPKTALLGGTIKRLGGGKHRSALGDDWWEDLDLTAFEKEPEVKLDPYTTSPDSLLHLSSLPTVSPAKSQDAHSFVLSDLVKFRDTEEDGSYFDVPTIKVAKSQLQQNPFSPPEAESSEKDDGFEADLVIPEDEPLQLAARRDMPSTPDSFGDDFDTEWAEGSIGVRFGGTKRGAHSNRSSTISALSPSISSCLTAESEDEGLDGLVLPDGPVDFKKSLQNRQQTLPPGTLDIPSGSNAPRHSESTNDDFFTGIEIGNGEAFNAGKLTLNRNVKRKFERPSSPARRRATSITFTSRNTTSGTRIPKLSAHERTHSTQLEPVSESGAPVPKFRRPNSRLGGHNTHSSLSNIPLPSPHSMASSLSPPSRRVIGTRQAREGLMNEPTTTNAQLLKAKRSAPIRSLPGNAASPPSRQEGTYRPQMLSRPKTPVDRSTTDSRLAPHRRSQAPFLPAGASNNQSQHVNVKTGRHIRRTDSDSSGDIFLNPRSATRLSKRTRSDIPGRVPDPLVDGFSATAKQPVTKPSRRRNFGDGTELDIFDDLPTSASTENKFVKSAIKRGTPRSLRNRLSQSHITTPSRTDTPVPSAPVFTPPQQEFTPRFARDTNASRNAREQRITSMNNNQGHREREGGPLAPINTNWKAQNVGRPLSSPSLKRSRHGHKNSVNRPHLIKPMGTGVQGAKSVKGMQYNPTLCKWEGNEKATAGFDALPMSTPSKPSPALISNVGGTPGTQVVGGMVFDPQRMCWLKLDSSPGNKGATTLASDEEDVFAGLDDLNDRPQKPTVITKSLSSATGTDSYPANVDDKSAGESSDEWPMTEEFDVGPEFIRRQRAEEEKWRRKVSKWVSEDRSKLGDEWRWAIRDLVRSGNSIDTPMRS